MLSLTDLSVFLLSSLVFLNLSDVHTIANTTVVAHGIRVASISVSRVNHVALHGVVIAHFVLIKTVEWNQSGLLFDSTKTLLLLDVARKAVIVGGCHPIVGFVASSFDVGGVRIFIGSTILYEIGASIEASCVSRFASYTLLPRQMVTGMR